MHRLCISLRKMQAFPSGHLYDAIIITSNDGILTNDNWFKFSVTTSADYIEKSVSKHEKSKIKNDFSKQWNIN